MVKYSDEEKICIISILRLIMQADMIIHPAEEQFLENTLTELEVTTTLLEHYSALDFQTCCAIIQRMDEEQKTHAINLFKDMAKCDGFVDPREMSIIDGLQ